MPSSVTSLWVLNIAVMKTLKTFKTFAGDYFRYLSNTDPLNILDGEVEGLKTYLYKEKVSKAPHQPYVLSSVWLLDLSPRTTRNFFIIPVLNSSEGILQGYIAKYINWGPKVYINSFSVYVNKRVIFK
jgi:hypothetical protein